MNSLTEIPAFLSISDHLSTAGQPTTEQFLVLQQSGHQIIINLALSNSPNALADEAEIVQSLEMQYFQIPVQWDHPTLEDLKQFFDILNQHQNQKILVHCAKNMRVSAFIYLYRVICQKVSPAEAQTDLNRIWTPNETWQDFINQAIAHYQIES